MQHKRGLYLSYRRRGGARGLSHFSCAPAGDASCWLDNPKMASDRKNVADLVSKSSFGEASLGIKHLTLRLPAAPDFVGDEDESLGLTRLRAMSELLTGERLTIHALLIRVIESAVQRKIELPVPKAASIPTGSSIERIDVRITREQIQMLDSLRDELKPRPDILDIREYYGRVDVLRQLLLIERACMERVFLTRFK